MSQAVTGTRDRGHACRQREGIIGQRLVAATSGDAGSEHDHADEKPSECAESHDEKGAHTESWAPSALTRPGTHHSRVVWTDMRLNHERRTACAAWQLWWRSATNSSRVRARRPVTTARLPSAGRAGGATGRSCAVVDSGPRSIARRQELRGASRFRRQLAEERTVPICREVVHNRSVAPRPSPHQPYVQRLQPGGRLASRGFPVRCPRTR